MKFKLIGAALMTAMCSTIAFADEITYEVQSTLNKLGYPAGSADGLWGEKTSNALASFASDHELSFDGEVSPEIWIKLAALARPEFPLPYLHLDEPLETNGSLNLVITNDVKSKYSSPACEWLPNFYQVTWGHPSSYSGYRQSYGSVVLPNVSTSGVDFDQISNQFHDSLIGSAQSCYANGDKKSCESLIDVVRWMKDEGAFVFNTETPELAGDTYYYTTKRILTPAMSGYSVAISEIGLPADHQDIGDWFYTALIQNSFDVFSPIQEQQKDMLFFEPPSGQDTACERDGLSLNHSLYQALGLSFYGSIWNDPNAASQAYDRLLYSFNSGAISEDGVMLCEASRGANAMAYSGSSMLNILYTFELARNQGVELETPEVLTVVDRAGRFIFDAAFDLENIYPYAAEDWLSWCSADYREQCMYNRFGRIATFSWMRHFAKLFPENDLSKTFLALRNSPVSENVETLRVSSAIVKSNYEVAEVDWEIPVDEMDSHEMLTRRLRASGFLNIMDVNLMSNTCAFPIE